MRIQTICVLIGMSLVVQADAADIAPERFPVKCSENGAFLPHVSSHPIGDNNEKIERVIIAIHSSGFDALKCYDSIQRSARGVPGTDQSALIIAPQFFDFNHIKETVPPGLISWKTSPYYGSSLAVVGPDKKDFRLSGYDVLDQMLANVTDLNRFPNLKYAVVVGHSSGGQMAQRYAVVGKFNPRNGVHLRYVSSAPSSFAYMTNERPYLDKGKVSFRVPDDSIIQNAPAYNNWAYGLDERYSAFRRASDDYIRNRYKKRCVLYLCGDKDTDMTSSSLSKTKAAKLQGRQRLERLEIYFKHLLHVYGEDIRDKHAMAVARGVDHNGFDAYASQEGRKFLFDVDRKDTNKDGTSDWQEWLDLQSER